MLAPQITPVLRRSSRLAKKAEIAKEKQLAEKVEQQRIKNVNLKREIHYLQGCIAEKMRDLHLMKKNEEVVITPRRSARLATKKPVNYKLFM